MEKETAKVLVVKADGAMRPMAGIWRDNEAGKFSAESYLKKNKEDTVVKATLIED